MKRTDKLRLNNSYLGGYGDLYSSLRSIFTTRDGALYDSDADELRTTSTGITPVSVVGDPVGMIQDLHLGLNPSTKGLVARVAGSYIDSPDRASNRPTGDITVIAKINADNYVSGASQFIYLDGAALAADRNILLFLNAAGSIGFWRPSGATTREFLSTVALSSVIANFTNVTIKAYFQQNVAGVSQVTFSYSTDDGSTYTQLGTIVTNANTGAGNANTTGIHIGSNSTGGATFGGKIYYTRVLDANNIVITSFKGTDYSGSGTTITSSDTGEVYTLHGSSYISPDGNQALQATAASRLTYNKRVNLLLASAVMATQNVTTKAIPYTLQFVGSGTVTLSGTSVAGPLVGGGTLTFTPTAGTLTLTVTGSVTLAQLEYGTTATRYQAITTATSFDEVGFAPYTESDGIDDSFTVATGGGGTTGFFYCEAFRPLMAAGTIRTMLSDAGTNTGYKVEIDATGKLSFSAGDGVAYTTVTSIAAVSPGDKTYIATWDDGVNLYVQLNGATAVSVARPVVSAGTTSFTLGKENGVAAKYRAAQSYASVYWKNTAGSSADRANAISWIRSLGGV